MKLLKLTAKKRKYAVLMCVLLIGLILGAAWVLFHPMQSDAAWFNDNYNYRIKVGITNSTGSDLTNFQVSATVDTASLITAGKLQSSCQDIRVTDYNGKVLPYWIEEGSATCNTSSTKIWTKLSTIPSAGSAIYIYYGNPSAASAAKGSDVFDFFDDFSAASLDSTKWGATGAYSQSGGALTITTGSVYSLNTISSQTGEKVEARLSYANVTANEAGMSIANAQSTLGSNSGSNKIAYLINNTSSFNIGAYAADGTTASYNISTGTSQFTSVAGTNYIVGTAVSASQVLFYKDRSLTNAYTGTWSSSFYAFLGSFRGSNGSTFDIGDITADWILARKHASTEPSTSNASEENGPAPILYWKFDDNTGTTANDSSLNSNPGTLGASTAAPTWQTDDQCIIGKCLKFDGSNDYVSRTYSSDIDLAPGTGSFTITAWTRHASTASGTDTLISRSNGAVNGMGYKVYMKSTGVICFGIDDDATTFPDDEACSTATYNDSKWHFIEGVKSGTSSITLFIDGKQSAQDASLTATGSLSGSSANLYVGIDSDATSNPWDGYIDEIKYYNFAKSSSQIQTDYAAKGSLEGSAVNFGSYSNSLSTGLVGYWKLDETAANGCTGGVNDNCDSSGNGLDGAWNGNATTAAGKFGSGVTFDGTNDFVDMGNPSALQITGAITVSAWVNTTTASTYQNIFGKNAAGQVNYYMYTNSNGTFGFSINDEAWVDGTTTFTANTWYHIVGTYIPGKSVKLYINGRFEGEDTTSVPNTINNYSQNFVVGGSAGGSNDYSGKIDDVRVYNRTLSSQEVTALYDWGPSPVLYMPFNEHTGTSTVNDYSGNGFSGTMSGFASTDWVPGKIGGGLNFDATNNYISVADNNTLDIQNAVTVEAWIKPHGLTGSDNGIALKGGAYELRFINAGKPAGRVLGGSSCGGGASSGVLTTSAVTLDNWYHIAWTYDGTTNKIYQNGVLNNTSTETCTIPSTANAFEIGRQSNYFNGTIDDVRVYNYVRTPKQIVQDMNGGGPAVGGVSSATNTVAYWPLDEGTGSTANDISRNSNNLTLNTSTSAWTTSGKFGSAWNGLGSNWLSRADDPDFDFDSYEDFSISMWVKSDSASNPSGTEYLLSKLESSAGYRLRFNTSGQLAFSIDDDATYTPDDDAVTTTDYYDNAWHNLVAIKTGTSKIELYVDGKLAASDTSIAATGTLANSISLYLGDRNGVDGGDEFNGDIDEVKIYRYALNPEEIKSEFNHGSSQVLGTTSTNSTGAAADNSAARTYCVPGDTASCSPPVAEWKLDERTGTTANDTSGNGLTGTLNGSTSWKPGKVGAAVNFTNAATDYINVGDNSNLDFGASADFTLEAWVYRAGATEQDAIIGKKNSEDACSSDPGYSFYITTAGLAKAWGCDSANNSYNVESNSTLSNNTWYHVAFVWDDDSTTNTAMYINGKKDTGNTSGTQSAVGDLSNALSFRIGSEADGGKNMNGNLDQVRVYSYARTPAQIAWDYNQGGPLAWYKFDECSGTTANDASGNGNTGTITIGATSTYTSAGTCGSGTSTHSWNAGATGKYSSAMALDGTDDYATVTASTSLNTLTTSLTAAVWVKPVGTIPLAFKRFISRGLNPSQEWALEFTSVSQGKIFYSTGASSSTSTNAIPSGSWSHIAMTYDGPNTSTKLYINGLLDSSFTAPSSITASSNIGIGADYDGTDLFTGQLDDVRIYNYPLTAAQVKNVYNEGSAIRFGQ